MENIEQKPTYEVVWGVMKEVCINCRDKGKRKRGREKKRGRLNLGVRGHWCV